MERSCRSHGCVYFISLSHISWPRHHVHWGKNGSRWQIYLRRKRKILPSLINIMKYVFSFIPFLARLFFCLFTTDCSCISIQPSRKLTFEVLNQTISISFLNESIALLTIEYGYIRKSIHKKILTFALYLCPLHNLLIKNNLESKEPKYYILRNWSFNSAQF